MYLILKHNGIYRTQNLTEALVQKCMMYSWRIVHVPGAHEATEMIPHIDGTALKVEAGNLDQPATARPCNWAPPGVSTTKDGLHKVNY